MRLYVLASGKMPVNKISFLTLKSMYALMLDNDENWGHTPAQQIFRNVLRAHLVNALHAVCELHTGYFERSQHVFDSSIAEVVVGELSDLTYVTRKLFLLYSEFVKSMRKEGQEKVASALLSSGIEIQKTCSVLAGIVADSLKDQLGLISVDNLPSLAEYTCKVIIKNLALKKVNSYLSPDTTNLSISSSSFILGCFLATFINPGVTKLRYAKTTSEGLLFRSAIKYQEKNTQVHMFTKNSKARKYRSREMYPEIFALFTRLYTSQIYRVDRISVGPTNLSSPAYFPHAIEHSALGIKNRLELTDVPKYYSEDISRPALTNRSSSLSILIAFFRYLAKLIKELIMRKQKDEVPDSVHAESTAASATMAESSLDEASTSVPTPKGHEQLSAPGDTPDMIKKKLLARKPGLPMPNDDDVITFLDPAIFIPTPENIKDRRARLNAMFFKPAKPAPPGSVDPEISYAPGKKK